MRQVVGFGDKHILETSIRGIFGDIFSFKIEVMAYEKFAKMQWLLYENINAR